MHVYMCACVDVYMKTVGRLFLHVSILHERLLVCTQKHCWWSLEVFPPGMWVRSSITFGLSRRCVTTQIGKRRGGREGKQREGGIKEGKRGETGGGGGRESYKGRNEGREGGMDN